MPAVAIHLGAGEAQVAGQSFRVASVKGGSLRLVDGGLELRPITFGERARLARAALSASDPEFELAAAVLEAARLTDGDHPAARAIALHLAGAQSTDLGFALVQSLLARQLGWTAADLADAPAADIDVLAAEWHRSVQTAPSGWTRVVFSSSATDPAGDIDSATLSMAASLLKRAAARIDPSEISGVVPAATHGTSPADPSPPNHLSAPVANAPTVVREFGETAGREDKGGVPEGGLPDIAPLAGTNAAALASGLTAKASVPQDAPSVHNKPSPNHTIAGFDRSDLSHGDRNTSGKVSSSEHLEFARQDFRQSDTPVVTQSASIWSPEPRTPSLGGFTAQSERTAAIFPALPTAEAQPRAFSGWFGSTTTPRNETARADNVADAPSRWVWDSPFEGSSAILALQEAHGSPVTETSLDALADALHDAADLRGVAR